MNKTILNTLASIPAAASLFAFAGSASAAALVGEMQFSSAFTNVDFSATSLIFGEQADGQNQVFVSSATGSFTEFQAAFINNLELIPDANPQNNPFLDLEANFSFLPGSTGDGLNVFNLTNVGNFNLAQSGGNVAIDLGFSGFFVSETGAESKGSGNLTFQINNATVADVQTNLANGFIYENIAFSGGSFAVVPESSSVMGLLALGLVGGLNVASKKKKISGN